MPTLTQNLVFGPWRQPSAPSDIKVRKMEDTDARIAADAFRKIGWPRPLILFEQYLREQKAGAREVFIAEMRDGFAGYVTLLWNSAYGPFREAAIPEVRDLTVLPLVQGRGIGSALVAKAETLCARRSGSIGASIPVGPDFGPAQILFARRGYVPDGTGVCYKGQPVLQGADVSADDDLTLFSTKEIG